MQMLTEIVGYVTDYIFSDDYTLWTVKMEDLETLSIQNKLTITDRYSLFGIMVLAVTLIVLFILEVWIIPVFGRFSAKVSIRIRKSFLWSALNLPIDLYETSSDGYLMESAGQARDLSYFLSKQMVEVIVRPLLAVYFLVVMAFTYLPCSIVVLVSVIIMVIATILSGEYESRAGQIVFTRQTKESGVKKHSGKSVIIPDRRQAILYAVSVAGPEDLVVAAGRGHENNLTVNGKFFPLPNDRELLLDAFKHVASG